MMRGPGNWAVAVRTPSGSIAQVSRQIEAANAALPAMRQLVQTYRLAVDQGNADVLSYYAAQSDLAHKEMDVLKLRHQLVNNQVGIEVVCGRFLPAPASAAPTTRPSTREVLP